MSEIHTRPYPASRCCRIVLNFDVTRSVSNQALFELVAMADIASIILYSRKPDPALLQRRACELVAPLQAQGVAVILTEEARIAVRVGADGFHSEEGFSSAGHKQGSQQMISGYGNVRDRHQAMEFGEAGADYIMFGKLGADQQSRPHKRNLALGAWWASMMEVPCIVQAGMDPETVTAVMQTGAEFVAIEEMIFAAADAQTTLRRVGCLLDNAEALS